MAVAATLLVPRPGRAAGRAKNNLTVDDRSVLLQAAGRVRGPVGVRRLCVDIKSAQGDIIPGLRLDLVLKKATDRPDMKKALLIFLMLLLPWQAFAAMERNLGHLSGRGHGSALAIKHMVEHAEHVLHHHDDDGDDDDGGAHAPHVDKSEKSVQHLAAYEQAGSMNVLLPSLSAPVSAVIARSPPVFWRDPFRTRTVLPLLRPPRLPA